MAYTPVTFHTLAPKHFLLKILFSGICITLSCRPFFPASVLFFLIFYIIPGGQYTKIKLLVFLLLLVKINMAILARVIKEITTIQHVKDNQSEQIR